MPKISVIMPTYNAETYVREAIESILNQTFADFEFLILDGGSKDKTIEIIESYNDDRIKIYKNCGTIPQSLNKGIKEATGEYIARMDADDISLPNLRNPPKGLVAVSSKIFKLLPDFITAHRRQTYA